MKTCPGMVDVGRRKFLTGAGVAAAGAAAASRHSADARRPARNLPGSATRITDSRISATSRSTSRCNVAYPDADAPGVLLKLGARSGGVGPDGDIVGFTTICPHKGFPLGYNAADKTLNCPGHYSRFDCENGGQQIWGHATQNLPQYALRVDDKGDIYAEGRRRTPLRPPVQRPLGGLTMALQAPYRPAADHPGGRQGAQRHLPLLHRRLRLQGLYLGRQQAGRRAPAHNIFGVDLSKQQEARDRRLVFAVDVQHRQAGRPRRSPRHQARQGLRREFRPRLDPRRADGRESPTPKLARRSSSV